MGTAGAAGAAAALGVLLSVGVAGQAPPSQEPPVFRADVDVIRLDVTVLDKDRKPVRGLTAADFTVMEDGRRQRVVAVTEVQANENDPVLTPRMRFVARDVAANDLVDRLGDGRVFALVLDDFNIPFDDDDIIRSTREAARYVIDNLGPSDVAAVIFTYEAGKTEDFTDDRSKLLAAVDRFEPKPRMPGYAPPTPRGPGPWGGDMAQRWAPVLMRSQCQRTQLLVPTLDTVAARLTSIPNRRKTMVVLTTGVAMNFGATSGCPGELASTMRDVFTQASRANINIYGIDPAGYRAYETYLQHPARNAQLGMRAMSLAEAAAVARRHREFLMTTAENTGGQAVVGTDEVTTGLDKMFDEDGSYYLVGYQSSNPRADGKFRKVEVTVSPPDTTVRTRSGYFAPRPGALANTDLARTASPNELGLAGMATPIGVSLRATTAAVALAEPGTSRDGLVAVALAVRYPASSGSIAETLTVTRNVYDAEGRAGAPTQERVPLTLEAAGLDGQRRDLFYALRLAPGRHQVRFEVRSAAIDRASSIIADVEVPDFSRARLAVSGLVLGSDSPARMPGPLASLLPIVPTTEREFTANASPSVFLRVFQSGPPQPVRIATEVLDGRDTAVITDTSTLSPEAFTAGVGAGYAAPLSFSGLSRGPHVLSVTASLPNGPSIRRDLLFRIR